MGVVLSCIITITAMENSWLEVPHLQTPLLPLLDDLNTHFEHSYDDSEDEIDEDRCFQMEIDQLKRENNFLKKKIAELTRSKTQPRKKSLPPHVQRPVNPTPVEQSNYIVAFFEQIARLLQEFSDLFKLGAYSTLSKDIQQQNEVFNALTLQNVEEMGRQLGKILLSPQQQRFSGLLGIFDSYYRQTTERSKLMRLKIESLTSQAIEIGKRMADSVRNREKIRSSRVFSVLQQQDVSMKSDNFSVRSSFMKSSLAELDLSMCRHQLQKEKMFLNIF